MASRIVYCRRCHSTFSTGNTSAGNCPDCRIPLMETGISTDEWRDKSDAEKEQCKATWGSDDRSPADELIYYLGNIEKNTRETARWIKFWSILCIAAVSVFLIVRCSL